MPRKRKLDKYVSSFVDRHGVERFRFRRQGASRYLPPPGSAEYKAAYAEALNGVIGLDRVKTGTINDLVARYYQSVGFQQASKGWQSTIRGVIEPFRNETGHLPVAGFETRHIEKEIAKRLEQRVVNGKRVGGTHAAKRFREVMNKLFSYAKKQKMIAENPVTDAEQVKHEGPGYKTWTEDEIRTYRARWPLGTKARLALELMLWTAMRRGNAHKAAPPKNGQFEEVAVKTGKAFVMPVAPALQAAIDAMPEGSIGSETLIINDFGRPFTAAGFGNKMREWCDAAGLKTCTAHGLRKALATRAANAGVSQQALKSVGQWENDAEAATYSKDRDRNQLAAEVIRIVAEAERLGNIG
jgi:integrase